MIKYKLGDIVEVISEREDNPSNCKYDKFVGLEHFIPGEVEIKKYGNTDLLKSAMKVFNAGDILVARRNVYLKRASIVKFNGITSGDSIVLRAKDGLLKRILPFVLNTDKFWEYAEKFSDGTMSKRLSPKILLEYEFNLPDIREQENLAELLWAANDTKEAYKKLLALTDDLARAIFIEMFGDPDTSSTTKVPFGECVNSMLKGPFGSDMKKSLFVEKGRETYKVYTQINAIQNDETLGSYYISKEYYEQKIYRFEVKPNDYIITCDGTLGKLIRLSPKMEPGVISPSLLKITINENKLNPKYFEYIWSNYMLDKLIGQARNTCLIHLPSATVIGKLIIPLPEIDKQNEFSSFIKQIENSTFDLNQTFLSLQNTVKSLMKQHIG